MFLGSAPAISCKLMPLGTYCRKRPLRARWHHSARVNAACKKGGRRPVADSSRNAAGQVTESKGLAVPAVESGSESYSIDAASNQLTVRAGKNYSYDAAGRLLSDGVGSFG